MSFGHVKTFRQKQIEKTTARRQVDDGLNNREKKPSSRKSDELLIVDQLCRRREVNPRTR